MPRGDKSSYTDKQKRKAQHIEEGYRERGISRDEAEQLIMQARVVMGWITEADLAPKTAPESEEEASA